MVHVRHEKIDTELVTSVEEVGRRTHIPAIVAPQSVRQIRADLDELGNGLFRAAEARGLHVVGGSSAFTGALRNETFHDLP